MEELPPSEKNRTADEESTVHAETKEKLEELKHGLIKIEDLIIDSAKDPEQLDHLLESHQKMSQRVKDANTNTDIDQLHEDISNTFQDLFEQEVKRLENVAEIDNLSILKKTIHLTFRGTEAVFNFDTLFRCTRIKTHGHTILLTNKPYLLDVDVPFLRSMHLVDTQIKSRFPDEHLNMTTVDQTRFEFKHQNHEWIVTTQDLLRVKKQATDDDTAYAERMRTELEDTERNIHAKPTVRFLESLDNSGQVQSTVFEYHQTTNRKLHWRYRNDDNSLSTEYVWSYQNLKQITYSDNNKESTISFNADCNPVAQEFHSTGIIDVFDPSTGDKMLRRASKKNEEIVSFFKLDGKTTFGRYDQEKQKNPNLSKKAYLAILAQNLNTPEKLWAYFEQYFNYIEDDDNLEIWQSAYQTLDRVKNGKMLGDCDDWAKFAAEVLQLQGKKARFIHMRRHATCVWTEERADGKIDVYRIGTFGLNKNGNGEKRDTGFASIEEGLNVVLNFPEQNFEYELESEHGLMPLSAFQDNEIYKDSVEMNRHLESKKALDLCEKFLKKYPQEQVFFLVKKWHILYSNDKIADKDNQMTQTLQKLVTLKPDNVRFQRELGKVYVRLKKIEQAEAHHLEMIKKGYTDWTVISEMDAYSDQLTPQQLEIRLNTIRQAVKKVTANTVDGNYTNSIYFLKHAFDMLKEPDKFLPIKQSYLHYLMQLEDNKSLQQQIHFDIFKEKTDE